MANSKGKEIMNTIAVAMMVVLIVVISSLIVGTLLDNEVFNSRTTSGSVTNETGAYINSTGYILDDASVDGFTDPSLTALYNYTDGTEIGLGNATLSSDGVMTNATATTYDNVSVSYTYDYNTGTSLAGVNVTQVGNSFGAFVTNLIAFLAIIGTIVGVVWLIIYVRKLFSKEEGIQDITA